MNKFVLLLIASLLISCEEQALQAVGQLESDRVELVAEFSEAIIAIDVVEGDELESGHLIIRQDSSRIDLRIQEALASIARIEAVLEEQMNGPRQETIESARANLNEVVIERNFRQRELDRLTGLREQNLTSIESVDAADKFFQTSGARIVALRAQLAELEAGTRYERIEQTSSQLQLARAQLASLELDKQRLTTQSPVTGIVDSLPFEVGERPRVGDVVAVLLTGDQPHARVYIPEPLRVNVTSGSQLSIHIDGREGQLTGTVRRIANEASFTPYFALTERDRSRLSYVAEVILPELPTRLPDGVPVQVIFEENNK